MSVSAEFQNRINDLISEEDLQKSDLPNKIGIDYSLFSKAVNYGIVPKPMVLMRIADYFNVSVEYLLAKTNDEHFYKAEKPSNFQERIESLRKSKDISYYELTKKLHIGKSYFSKWKIHGYLPSFELLVLIADYFDVSIDYLLGRTDDK